ncbi:DUF3164 family protein [Azospirillum melinis]|uniref:DUF3164 family protein n=2 Tax=Azospirillum melinis TaxID=328839 RepID=A0ABX2KLC6_9PROT|nr:DUF3164 family protein [Azospirillum melinis]
MDVPERKDGYYEDARGRLIPSHLVKDTDLLEDQLVRNLMGGAETLAEQMRVFRAMVFNDVAAFLALLAEKYDAKRGGKKGNMTFTSFDGKQKVQVAVADHLTFGPELQIAKGLIDECIGEWAKDTNDNIRVLVDHAFRVDKEGQVSRESIFALRRVNITDPRWEKAMAAIADSVQVQGTKTYVRFYQRDSQESPWKPLSLDLANA